MEAAYREFAVKRAKGGDALHIHIDRKKQEFAQQAAQLAEKRLALAEAEKRLNESK
jgi:hypothetical protein